MSDEIDALEEIADSNTVRPNVGSRRPVRTVNNLPHAYGLSRGVRAKIKSAQTSYLIKKQKLEGK